MLGVLKIERETKSDTVFERPVTLIIRQSRIHSYGCYTTRPIRKGTLIVEYVGERLTLEQAEDLYDPFPNTYLFGLDDGERIIDGFGVAAFVNHSCKPNCETDQIRGKMWIIAQRDIEAGEELTYDYNLYDGEDDAPCFCGAPRCRRSLYSATHLRKLAKKRAKTVMAAASAAS
jgi:SET domain-containing protein